MRLYFTKFCDNLPTCNFSINNSIYIKNLKLAYEAFNHSGHTDLFLGADMSAKIILPGKLAGQNNEPVAMNIILVLF